MLTTAGLAAVATVFTAAVAGFVAALTTTGLVAVATVVTAAVAGFVAVLTTTGLAAVATVLTAAVAGFVALPAGGAELVAVLTTLATAAVVDPVAGAEDATAETELTGLTTGGEDDRTDGVAGASPDVRVTAAAAPPGTARTANSKATAEIQRILNLQTSPTCAVSLPRKPKNLPIF